MCVLCIAQPGEMMQRSPIGTGMVSTTTLLGVVAHQRHGLGVPPLGGQVVQHHCCRHIAVHRDHSVDMPVQHHRHGLQLRLACGPRISMGR